MFRKVTTVKDCLIQIHRVPDGTELLLQTGLQTGWQFAARRMKKAKLAVGLLTSNLETKAAKNEINAACMEIQCHTYSSG